MKIADLSNPLVDIAGLLLIGGLLALRLRARRVSIRRLWILPVALSLLTLLVLVRGPAPDSMSVVWFGAACVAGLAVGAARGRMVDVRRVDAQAGVIVVQSTLLGVILWMATFAARIVVRQVVGRANPDEAIVDLVTGSLLLFAVGTVVANAAATYRAFASSFAEESTCGPAPVR